MKKSQIAAQLFTLRDFLKTPEDIAASLRKVKQIGYDAVQVSGMGPVAEEELVKILDGEGLICCATHEPGKKIVEETAAELYWRRGFCSGSVCRSYCGNAGRRSRLPPGNHSP